MAQKAPLADSLAGRTDLGFIELLNRLLSAAARSRGDAKPVLQSVLDAGLTTVGGHRGFLALVNHETGEMEVACTAGEGWTDETRRMRLSLAQENNRGITGHVAVTRMSYITGDVTRDPYYLCYFPDVCSEIAVPIMSQQGEARGVINIDSPENDAFDEEDSARLTALAQAAGIALTLEGFHARESALIEIGRSLTTTLETDEIATKVVHTAASVLRFEDCSVFLLDEQTDHLILRASCCLFGARVGSPEYQMGEGIIGWVAQHGEPVRMENPTADPRWVSVASDLGDEDVGAYLAVPIHGRERVLGVLRVLRRKSHAAWFSNRFTETDERILSTIASQLGAAIENARSFHRLVRSERMAAWGELSARSAHMIGNRAFALKGDLNELQYLLESLPTGETRAELEALASSMQNGIERLEEILREFRDYVVATQIAPADVDLNALVKETVEESFPRRAKVRLTLDLDESIPNVRIDARRMQRAFSELIENAITFMPEGGELRIATRFLKPEERAEHRLSHARQYAAVEFADTGPGISEESKDRIFRPFYTSRVKGMGLGLSIVKGIVEAHQGIIREAGKPGEGAKFLIFLPVQSPEQQA